MSAVQFRLWAPAFPGVFATSGIFLRPLVHDGHAAVRGPRGATACPRIAAACVGVILPGLCRFAFVERSSAGIDAVLPPRRPGGGIVPLTPVHSARAARCHIADGSGDQQGKGAESRVGATMWPSRRRTRSRKAVFLAPRACELPRLKGPPHPISTVILRMRAVG